MPLLLCVTLQGEDRHYELGVGLLGVSYPSYIGAKTTHQLLVPIPEFTYHAPQTTIDKNGIEQQLFGMDGVRLDLSMGGSLPSSSQHSDARAGMPDLDLAFEVGPRIKYQLHQDAHHQLEIRLPLRAVISTDFEALHYRGYLITPDLRYQYTQSHLELTCLMGPLWSSQHYNRYFYGVSSQYVTASRNLYDAKAGYSGYQATIGWRERNQSWRYGGFVSYFDLHHATFEDSPLVETKTALFGGVYLSYIFFDH